MPETPPRVPRARQPILTDWQIRMLVLFSCLGFWAWVIWLVGRALP